MHQLVEERLTVRIQYDDLSIEYDIIGLKVGRNRLTQIDESFVDVVVPLNQLADTVLNLRQ